MNRREFSLQLAGLAGAAALSGLGLPGLALRAGRARSKASTTSRLQSRCRAASRARSR